MGGATPEVGVAPAVLPTGRLVGRLVVAAREAAVWMAEVMGRVNRDREEGEATGQGSMVTGAGAMATGAVAMATVAVARVRAAKVRVVAVRVRALAARARVVARAEHRRSVRPMRCPQRTDWRCRGCHSTCAASR